MNKEKAKAAFEKWYGKPNEQNPNFSGVQNKFFLALKSYLAGAEWAWGERSVEFEDLIDLGTDQVVTERIEKLQAELSQVKKAKDALSVENKKFLEQNQELGGKYWDKVQELKEKDKTIEKLRLKIEHAVKYLDVTYGCQLEVIDHPDYEPEHEILISFKQCLKEIEGE